MKKKTPRSTSAHKAPQAGKATLSLDWWTVVVGVALAALVLAGLPAIPW